MSNYPNMSYCMFENTTLALKQIMDELQEVSSMQELLKNASSTHERVAIKQFFQMIPEIAEMLEDLSVEDYNS